MAQEPKPKTKPTRKPKFTDKAQSERFIEAARTLGIVETGKPFDEAFERVVINKPSIPSNESPDDA
jgi:hypothetical protein